jgi:hypothetical protein
MHGPINVKSPNNISKWQMGFNSAFKGLMSPSCYRTAGDSSKYYTVLYSLMEGLVEYNIMEILIILSAFVGCNCSD